MDKGAQARKMVVCLTLGALCSAMSVYAAKEVKKYAVHDMSRPRPPVVMPADEPGGPPSDAIILFDGKSTPGLISTKGGEVGWKIENGYMEVVKKSGGIRTKEDFGNCQLHVEWATPAEVKGSGQGRGNSGIFFMGRYEVQILDSYKNETYADGQAAAIYGQHPPMFNACREPGEWQSYDIVFLRPLFDGDKLVRKARITVLHNGVAVHNNLEIEGSTFHKKKAAYSPHPDELPITIQNHGNPVRFRNVWVRRLPEQPYLVKD